MFVARTRMAMLGRHIQTMPIFPVVKACVDVHPTMISGYTIRMDVRHDEKIIDFVTEAMCSEEKRLVYLPQKKMMREMYPEYMIVEKHT
jgi:hypothetical protein